MNLQDKLPLNTQVYCPAPTRGFGYVRNILNEGEPFFTKEHSFIGYYSFEVVFPDTKTSFDTPQTGVYYLTAQQVIDNEKNNKGKEKVLWLVDYTWQYTLLKFRKNIIIN